jgi:ligand-binding sensor domain-containing protein
MVVAMAVGSLAAADDGPRLVGSWTTVANPDDVTAIALAPDRVWVGTRGGGVAAWSEGRLLRQYLGPQDGLPCNDVNDIVEWRGTWWFATCSGLAVYDRVRDRMESVPADLPSPAVSSLAVDSSDRLWAGTAEWWDPLATPSGATSPGGWRPGGLSLSEDGRTWNPAPGRESWPSANVADLESWRDALWVAAVPHHEWAAPGTGGSEVGRWVSTGGGVGRFGAGSWTVWGPEQESALASAVTAVAAGPAAIWFGTSGRGLAAFDGGRWTSYRACSDGRRCLPDDYVSRVEVGTDGAVWVATQMFNGRGTGLSVLDPRNTPADPRDDAWRTYTRQDGLPADTIAAIMPAATDAGVWLGASDLSAAERRLGRGLVHLLDDRSTVAVYTSLDQPGGAPPDNVITALAWDAHQHRLFVGTDGMGLGEWRPESGWLRHTRASTGGGLASDSITDMVVAPDGALWVATGAVTLDAQGRSWVDGGLSRLQNGAWRSTTSVDGLPSNHLSAVALDGRGKVWVGTGATRFGPKELRFRGAGLAVVDQATGAWERTYTFPTLTSNNVTDIAVRGNEVWVATSYFFYVDTRPGGAQFHTGGGVSVFELDQNRWRTYTAEDGLTPSLESRGLGSLKPLLDLRAILPSPSGEAWIGGGAYPEARFVDGLELDGTLDMLSSSGVTPLRFAGSGPVSALDRDAAGNVWTGTAGGGLKVLANGTWLTGDRQLGRLPDADLTAIESEGPEPWVGTAGMGLARLVPPPTAVPTDPALPTPTQSVIMRLEHQVFVPRVLRQRLPIAVQLPRP